MGERDMDLVRLARRVSDKSKAKIKSKAKAKVKSAKPKKTEPEIPEISDDFLNPGVEYSFKVDLSFSVNFEGESEDLSEDRLRKKLKSEILAAMKGAALMAANDFGLRATNISMSPVTINSAMNDQSSVGERGW